jgi:hypothetical protein
MNKYRVPLLFFCIGIAMGTFLRWQYIMPTAGVNFRNVVHGHSHLMFSGWVLNVLLFAFIDAHVKQGRKKLNILLIALQVCTVGMLVSFPVQGYGLISIIFSTSHTFIALCVIILFFRQTKTRRSISLWFARASLIFFALSTIGPFSLGYLSSQSLTQTHWYDYSIYFYLHFQYNGCFTFGILSLFYQLLENKNIAFDYPKAKAVGLVLAWSCVPAFFLSILYNKPGIVFNVIGGLAAVTQIIAFDLFQKQVGAVKKDFFLKATRVSKTVLYVVLFAWSLKLLLQFTSSLPAVTELLKQLRPVVIGYLHLMLIGVVSLFLILFMIEKRIMSFSSAAFGFKLLLVGFIGSELCQVLVPWWSEMIPTYFPSSPVLLFTFSLFLFAAGLVFVYASFSKGSVDSKPATPQPET